MAGFETAPADLKPLLSQRISELGLKLEGLTDEWGCPDEEPIIGIPFYLADVKLAQLEKAIDDVENARAIRMYLRHGAGHAFNYAYRAVRNDGMARAVRPLLLDVLRDFQARRDADGGWASIARVASAACRRD